LACFLISRWLETIAYHVEVGAAVFTLGMIIVIAWLSLSYRALWASRVNPALVLNQV